MNWKYKDSNRHIAIRTTSIGIESVLVSSLPIGTLIDNEDPKTTEEIALEDFFNKTKIEKSKLDINPVVKYLREHTTEEIDTYIQTNVTNLADVKNILSKLATAIGVLLRD